MPREAITTWAATVNSGDRLAAVMRGEVEAIARQLRERAGRRRNQNAMQPARYDAIESRNASR